jgi:Ring hydroxylating beta subunit
VETDDERMSAAHHPIAGAAIGGAPHAGIELQDAIEFIWLEADLLDSQDYQSWLSLWIPSGHYVIPIERTGDDHAAQLNIIYDDQAMRAARVKRLTSGLSMSASPSARTVRTVSRFRRIEANAAASAAAHPGASAAADTVTDSDGFRGATLIRCAQHLVEYKYDRTRVLAANVTYRLVREGSRIALERKVVRLINSDDALFGIGYLL